MTDGKTPAERTPPITVCMFGALLAAGLTVLLLRAGSGHTPASRRFAELPQFSVWVWSYAAEVGAAAVLALLARPAFLRLATVARRPETRAAVMIWLLLGLLIGLAGPRAIAQDTPLYLGHERAVLINAFTWVLVSFSFAGLILAHRRILAMAGQIEESVAAGTAGELTAELLRLRTAMLRFLITFAAVVTGGMLALGALRRAMVAFGSIPVNAPDDQLLVYGALLALLSAVIFIPAYLAWQDRAFELRDALFPIPADGRMSHDWVQSRDDHDAVLMARLSAGRVLATAFGILAPFVGSLVSALLLTQPR